jgi:hypothetical protein
MFYRGISYTDNDYSFAIGSCGHNNDCASLLLQIVSDSYGGSVGWLVYCVCVTI